jgi:hypothetical protein
MPTLSPPVYSITLKSRNDSPCLFRRGLNYLSGENWRGTIPAFNHGPCYPHLAVCREILDGAKIGVCSFLLTNNLSFQRELARSGAGHTFDLNDSSEVRLP